MKHDLTKGNITGHLVRMSVPTMLGLSAQMVYDLVDIFWIGKISAQAVAGVTIFSTLFGLICTLNSIIGQS
ncbi:MAG TPA: MATE family efflux transporter [Thermotogota bacterium]|nr:MATE family efflux transporter [Thermotogota bacterium]